MPETSARSPEPKRLVRWPVVGCPAQVLIWATADEVLTPKRRELIETLRTTDADSIRALARELERDKGQASRAPGVLAERGIVHYETDGNAKRPQLTQEHIIIEPIA